MASRDQMGSLVGSKLRAAMPVATRLKTTLRALARVVVRTAFDRRTVRPITPPKHILVVRWDGKLGDAMVSSFFYREAKKLGAMVSVVTTVDLASMHREHFGAHHVVVVPSNPSWMSLWQLIAQLRDVDTVVHPVGRIRARELIFLSLLSPRNVFSLDDEIGWVNGKMQGATASLLFNEKYAYILRQLGVHDIDTRYVVPSSTTSPHATKGRPYLIFNPFASRPDKSISKEKSAHLLGLLAARLDDWDIGILNHPATRTDALGIQHAVNIRRVHILEGVHTFEDAIAVVADADLVVSVDTGFVHVADGLEKRLIAICATFDNGFNAWSPRALPSTRIIWCPQDHECYRRTGKKDMDNFDDAAIHEALDWLLGEPAPVCDSSATQP